VAAVVVDTLAVVVVDAAVVALVDAVVAVASVDAVIAAVEAVVVATVAGVVAADGERAAPMATAPPMTPVVATPAAARRVRHVRRQRALVAWFMTRW
jgi:hypothetical protein